MTREAIARAVAHLRTLQRDDGSWDAPADVGPAATAQVAICLAFAGALGEGEARAIARWLARRALPSGAFALFPSAPRGDRGATAYTAAFLRAHGDDEARAAAARAEAFVAANGGTRDLPARIVHGDLAALYLAMARALDPARLPAYPLWALANAPAERWFLRRFHAGVLMTAHATGLITRRLRGASRAGAALEPRVRARAVHWLSELQNPEGSWNAWAPVTALHVAALHSAGLGADDPRVARALAWLRRERREDADGPYWNAFATPHWATCFTVLALREAGVHADDPALARAGAWLLAAQCRAPQAACNHAAGAAGPRVGGFAYRPDNPVLPDADDTAAALSALAALRTSTPRADLERAIGDARAWLLGMQNPDGGFSSYVCGLPGKPAGPLFARGPTRGVRGALARARARMLELGDPSTEDVTGRALHALAAVGDARAPAAARALAFARAQQLADGSFWGRWLCNYLAGTAYVVRGAVAAGEDPRAPWLARALDFLEQSQRDDGAWGEDVRSYADPARFKARGEPCAAATGRVLCALIDGGHAASPAVARGVRWLLARQRADGSWDGSTHLATIYPPETFYRHAPAGTYYPLWALALFAAHAPRA